MNLEKTIYALTIIIEKKYKNFLSKANAKKEPHLYSELGDYIHNFNKLEGKKTCAIYTKPVVQMSHGNIFPNIFWESKFSWKCSLTLCLNGIENWKFLAVESLKSWVS